VATLSCDSLTASRSVLRSLQGNPVKPRKVAYGDLFDPSGSADRYPLRSSGLSWQHRRSHYKRFRVLALGSVESVTFRRTREKNATAARSSLPQIFRRWCAAPDLFAQPRRDVLGPRRWWHRNSCHRDHRCGQPSSLLVCRRPVSWDIVVGRTLMWKARPGSFLVRAIDQQGRAVAEELKVVAAINW
jgi:hypothetical protein